MNFYRPLNHHSSLQESQNSSLEFFITNHDKLKIEFPCPAIEILLGDYITVKLALDTEVVLADDCFICLINNMEIILTNVIDTKLPIPHFKKNIGYRWNQHLKYPKRYEMIDCGLDLEMYRLFVGHENPNVITWLYNKDQRIVLEITPVYQSDSSGLTYRDFMKHYRPIYKTTISVAVAKHLLKHVISLKNQAFHNNEKLKLANNTHV